MKDVGVDAPSDIPSAAKSGGCSRRAKFFGFIVLVSLVAISVGFFIKEKRVERRSRMMDGMKMFGLALLEFDQEFGVFPSDDTAEEVAKRIGTHLPLTGANVLNQLRAYGLPEGVSIIEEIGREDAGWSYFSGSGHCGHPRHPLLVSPPVNGDRLVLRIDNTVGVLGENELENLPDHICNPVDLPPDSDGR